MKQSLLALAATLPLAATELPPMVESGPVHYNDISYQAPAPQTPAYAASACGTPAYAVPAYSGSTYYSPAPLQPAASHNSRGEIVLNAYSTNYQVRGMGVTNFLSDHGYSSVSGSYTLPNRNLFNCGIHQRVSGTLGAIWGGSEELGDTPLVHLHYAIGREILPNLIVEAGYSLRRGGFEGFMARATGCSHRIAQDFNVSISFNDHQRGFFGHVIWGLGFQGLTGSYFDLEAGYRFTDIATRGNLGTDLELSAGIAPSVGYWGGGVEGIDAYRLRAALRPYSHSGQFGRDAHLQLTPWVQCSWTGHNAAKLDRRIRCCPADHFQITFGLDLGWRF